MGLAQAPVVEHSGKTLENGAAPYSCVAMGTLAGAAKKPSAPCSAQSSVADVLDWSLKWALSGPKIMWADALVCPVLAALAAVGI